MAKKQIGSKVLTVSEIAEKAGVSRNKVWSYIRRNKIKPVSKKSGQFKFDSKIVLEIEDEQQKKRIEKNKKENNAGISVTVLEIFKKQLEKKDQQIKDQAEIIDFLKGEVLRARLDSQNKEKLLEDAWKKVE
ncbi:helix-turn-helix domain-containing protein, partial [Lactobacillus helveticus]